MVALACSTATRQRMPLQPDHEAACRSTCHQPCAMLFAHQSLLSKSGSMRLSCQTPVPPVTELAPDQPWPTQRAPTRDLQLRICVANTKPETSPSSMTVPALKPVVLKQCCTTWRPGTGSVDQEFASLARFVAAKTPVNCCVCVCAARGPQPVAQHPAPSA